MDIFDRCRVVGAWRARSEIEAENEQLREDIRRLKIQRDYAEFELERHLKLKDKH